MKEPLRQHPEIELPAYSYVPGKFPHPISDPDGHSYQSQPPVIDSFDANAWPDCDAYLRGIDLFNSGYYWEAHESWEAVWIATGRNGRTADFLKGLIKLAAALVKAREGNERGVMRHATRAIELFREVHVPCEAEQVCLLGLRLSTLIADSRRLAEQPNKFLDACDTHVVRIGDFILRLEREQRDA